MKKTIVFLLLLSAILGAFCIATTETDAETEIPEEPAILVTYEPEISTPVVEIEDYFPLTTEERQLVWQVIYAEVRGCKCENDECMFYVAECIRDRVLERGYGSNVTSVITAKNQFAYLNGPADEELDTRINNAIDRVFVDGEFAFDEPILHFHADWCTPYWVNSFERLATTCGTYFYN